MGSGRLKPGWTRVAFGDVVRQVRDHVDPATADLRRYVAGEHMDTNGLRIRRWGTVGDGYLGPAFHMRFRPGHVLYGSRRTYLRKVAVADFEGVTANTTFVIDTRDPNVLLPELLPFIMQTEAFHEHSIKKSKGSVNPYVNFSDIAAYDFALPPLDEQRRITYLLHASDTVGHALRELLDAIGNTRQAVIDHLTQDSRWPKVRIEDLCEMQNGRPFPRSEYVEEGLRLLRPGNLGPVGGLLWERSKTVCLPERWRRTARDFLVRKGDVLINLTAQSLDDRFMGRVCLARTDDTSLLNQRIGRFRGWNDRILPEYVFRVLQSTQFQRHVRGMCEGSKIKHLFWSHIGRFVARMPPMSEQESVVEVLKSVDGLLHGATQRGEEQRLFRGLLLLTLD